MKLALVTDAWEPQVNGVVTTLVELVRELSKLGHEVTVIHPGLFKTVPCPGYKGIDLALLPGRKLSSMLDALVPDAIHVATEGPLGWAARSHCKARRLAFTSAFHTKFPEILYAAVKFPLNWGYSLFKHFHKASAGVMVPTDGVLRMLEARGFRNLRPWTHGVDVNLFEYHSQPRVYPDLGVLARPVSLYIGRVSYEKNIDAFLALDLPGSKVVCGVGPLEQQLKQRFAQVHWLGILPRTQLAKLYAAADVFVFPSRSETFGLVMLEAMATGTPVAAFPVDGPLEVLGHTDDAGVLRARGGAMAEDLQSACYNALAVPRHEARSRAMSFSWRLASDQFLGHLVGAVRGTPAHSPTPAQPVGSKLSSSS